MALYNNGMKIADIVRNTELSRSTVNRIIKNYSHKAGWHCCKLQCTCLTACYADDRVQGVFRLETLKFRMVACCPVHNLQYNHIKHIPAFRVPIILTSYFVWDCYVIASIWIKFCYTVMHLKNIQPIIRRYTYIYPSNSRKTYTAFAHSLLHVAISWLYTDYVLLPVLAFKELIQAAGCYKMCINLYGLQ